MILLILFVITFLIILIVILFWMYVFFLRNPDRKIDPNPNIILAPADGFIVYCKKIKPNEDIISIKKKKQIKLEDLMFIDDKKLLTRPGWLIGTFMTCFDVHYNRAPIGGYIKKIRHDFPTSCKKNQAMFIGYKSLFLNQKKLWNECDFIITNERASYIIKNKKLSIYVTQIADRYVNKIKTFKNNEEIKQGEIFGLIRMGSQVDVFIPDDNDSLELCVKKRQKVKAGITPLMILKNKYNGDSNL
jgi:phosphatidylserine decarboxylase